MSDVRQFLKGTADVEKALDDVAGSLDDLARETAKDADKAGDAIERSFSDALKEVRQETKKTARDMGDDLKRGTKDAGEGFDDLKDEAKDSAKEAAASFSGEFEDVADYVQEVLAQALQGFGPIGAAAGIAAAAGIGILVANLQDSAEKAKEAQEAVADLAGQLYDVKGDPRALDYLSRMQELVGSIVDEKSWYEFWQPKNVTWIEQQDKLWANSNTTMEQRNAILRAQAGDTASAEAALNAYNQAIEAEQRNTRTWVDQYGVLHRETSQRAKDLTAERDQLQQTTGAMAEAKRQYEAVAAADQKRAQAIEAARESDENFAASLRDNGTVLDGFADKIVKGGKIVYSAWTKLRRQMRSDNKIIMDVDADPRLSSAARENFRNLPREVQVAIAREFKKGGKADDKVIAELNADAKVNVGKVEPSAPIDPLNVPTKADANVAGVGEARANAQAQAADSPIKFRSVIEPPALPKLPATKPLEWSTKVDPAGAVKGAQTAADAAQKVANSERNKIEYRTKVNTDGLQAAVNRAAARITAPTIYARVKAKKDVE
ncbi:MAG: hypothetical protein QM582_14070 [Micropruina sp.]|uniref:hypothetical protein n=1 Tax=Micropruina sp. TaxID=2737536 RepID=UPI0039E4ECD0